MIEGRQSTRHLGLLVVGLAVVSNFGQYYFTGSPYFCGMSGVIYGLLGYVYMKGRFDPSSGLGIRQQTMIMMLVWFVVCWTGAVGAIANYAHTIGLLAGVAWGFLASIPAMRRTN
jgi:GlpG protein